MKIVEIKVKKILGESKITDYTINPYIGCQHSCFYCYSKHYTRKFLKEKEEWGKFVYVKVNAAKILEKEIRKKKKGSVYLSSLTDPYQPIEKKYKITREILDVLAKNNWKVIIQTKSSLVLRDLDILKKFEEIEVGFTITTLNENLRKIIEPFSSSIKERINALKKLKKENIRTFLFVGPLIFPFVNFEEIRKLIGYMPESSCIPLNMDAVRVCTYFGQLVGMPKNDAMERAHACLDYVGLKEERYRLAGTYSTGMLQRLKMAQALVHDPELIFCDEPTNGLDPTGREEMLELIKDPLVKAREVIKLLLNQDLKVKLEGEAIIIEDTIGLSDDAKTQLKKELKDLVGRSIKFISLK